MKRGDFSKADSVSEYQISGGVPDYTSLESFIMSISQPAISSLRRIEAHNFCIDRNIRSFPVLGTTQAWQESQLSIDGFTYVDKEDGYIVARIIEYLLQAEARRLKALSGRDEDIYILLKYSHEHIARWSRTDLVDYCLKHGLDPSGDLYEQVHHHKVREYLVPLNAYMHSLPPQDFDHDSDNVIIGYVRGKSLEEYDTAKDLKRYLTIHKLPTWGTERALVARVKRHQRNELLVERGEPAAKRQEQSFRLDSDHNETYVFHALLHASSVAALKSALFITGNLAPEATLHLYFHPNEADVLHDKYPLARYAGRDWSKLRLKVTQPAGVVRKNLSTSIREVPTKEELQAARRRELRNGAPPTLVEKVKQLSDSGEKLLRLSREKSALAMVQSLRDFEEGDAVQDGLVGDVVKGSDMTTLLLPGSGPMADVYWRQQRKLSAPGGGLVDGGFVDWLS